MFRVSDEDETSGSHRQDHCGVGNGGLRGPVEDSQLNTPRVEHWLRTIRTGTANKSDLGKHFPLRPLNQNVEAPGVGLSEHSGFCPHCSELLAVLRPRIFLRRRLGTRAAERARYAPLAIRTRGIPERRVRNNAPERVAALAKNTIEIHVLPLFGQSTDSTNRQG